MKVVRRAVVIVLAEDEAEYLKHQLATVIALGYIARNKPPPFLLLELARMISDAADGSADGSAANRRSSEVSGTAEPATAPVLPQLGQPVRLLTVTEAARAAKVSTGYVRRLCRKGVLGTRDPAESSWSIDTDELDAWMLSRSRKEHDREAA